MRLKKGVRVRGMSPEILLAILIADTVYAEHDECMVITSITDGKHSVGSHHYTGEAVDLRLPELDVNVDSIVTTLINDLGSEYDVVLEERHIHVEYDPK